MQKQKPPGISAGGFFFGVIQDYIHGVAVNDFNNECDGEEEQDKTDETLVFFRFQILIFNDKLCLLFSF